MPARPDSSQCLSQESIVEHGLRHGEVRLVEESGFEGGGVAEHPLPLHGFTKPTGRFGRPQGVSLRSR